MRKLGLIFLKHTQFPFFQVLPWLSRGCQGQQNSLSPPSPSLLHLWVLTLSLTPKTHKQTLLLYRP